VARAPATVWDVTHTPGGAVGKPGLVEQETGNNQLKTHLRGPGKVPRSRLPDLVHQEIYAYLIVHHAICALIAKASAADRISFAKTLRLIRRSATVTADIPP
jgi:hypothetical protein